VAEPALAREAVRWQTRRASATPAELLVRARMRLPNFCARSPDTAHMPAAGRPSTALRLVVRPCNSLGGRGARIELLVAPTDQTHVPQTTSIQQHTGPAAAAAACSSRSRSGPALAHPLYSHKRAL
jgi:hypothetical protein